MARDRSIEKKRRRQARKERADSKRRTRAASRPADHLLAVGSGPTQADVSELQAAWQEALRESGVADAEQATVKLTRGPAAVDELAAAMGRGALGFTNIPELAGDGFEFVDDADD